MSTYLKTAAMSLLSKTLQTFLTKYLSDVDVEGITLPSYDGSGTSPFVSLLLVLIQVVV